MCIAVHSNTQRGDLLVGPLWDTAPQSYAEQQVCKKSACAALCQEVVPSAEPKPSNLSADTKGI
ncbi:hypothetical protein J6590_074008 [Homalodisca vitripennis]|nr:hypothetical protein J6590_074008 [Homalodisca vitripennis]